MSFEKCSSKNIPQKVSQTYRLFIIIVDMRFCVKKQVPQKSLKNVKICVQKKSLKSPSPTPPR